MYGLQEDGCRELSQSSKSSSDSVHIGIPTDEKFQSEYCFTVTASNETFTAVVEGTLVASI